MITYVERRHTNCVKWDGREEKLSEDLLPMWIADMDFKVPSCITDAIAKFNDFGVYGYCTPRDEYFDAIVNWEKRRHNVDVKKEWIISSADVLQAIGWIIDEFTNEKDKIMLSSPVYNPFFELIKSNDRVIVDNKLLFDGKKYSYDFEDFEAIIVNYDVKLYILCNPHNPIGQVWKKEDLAEIIRICKKHNVYIISDEIHQDLVYAPNVHYSLLNFANEYKNIFVLTSTSKTFSLASLKNAFAFIPDEENAKRYLKTQDKLRTNMGNTLGYIATEAAFNGGEKWLEEAKEYIYENFLTLKKAFEDDKDIFMSEIEGTFLVWMKISCIEREMVMSFLKEKCKIEVNAGEWFGGDDYLGFFRVNIATSKENVEEFIKRIKTGLDKVRK